MNANFDFSQSLVLEDELVLLRPLQEADVENLIDISMNEPETWHYSLVRANGRENLENYIQIALAGRNNKTDFPFIVFDKKSGKYAGSTRFYDFDESENSIFIGYTFYGTNSWGKGINPQVKKLNINTKIGSTLNSGMFLGRFQFSFFVVVISIK